MSASLDVASEVVPIPRVAVGERALHAPIAVRPARPAGGCFANSPLTHISRGSAAVSSGTRPPCREQLTQHDGPLVDAAPRSSWTNWFMSPRIACGSGAPEGRSAQRVRSAGRPSRSCRCRPASPACPKTQRVAARVGSPQSRSSLNGPVAVASGGRRPSSLLLLTDARQVPPVCNCAPRDDGPSVCSILVI